MIEEWWLKQYTVARNFFLRADNSGLARRGHIFCLFSEPLFIFYEFRRVPALATGRYCNIYRATSAIYIFAIERRDIIRCAHFITTTIRHDTFERKLTSPIMSPFLITMHSPAFLEKGLSSLFLLRRKMSNISRWDWVTAWGRFSHMRQRRRLHIRRLAAIEADGMPHRTSNAAAATALYFRRDARSRRDERCCATMLSQTGCVAAKKARNFLYAHDAFRCQPSPPHYDMSAMLSPLSGERIRAHFHARRNDEFAITYYFISLTGWAYA